MMQPEEATAGPAVRMRRRRVGSRFAIGDVPYDNSRAWTEDDVLAWLEDHRRKIVDDPHWRTARNIIDAAVGLHHDRVFWWYYTDGWISNHHKAFDLYMTALSSVPPRMDLAEHLQSKGISLPDDYLTATDHQNPEVVAWLIMHASPAGLAAVTEPPGEEELPFYDSILIEGHQYGALRRLLFYRPGRNMTAPSWESLEWYILHPKLSPSQLEWVPLRWAMRAKVRQVRIGGSLGAVLPPDLVKYIITGI